MKIFSWVKSLFGQDEPEIKEERLIPEKKGSKNFFCDKQKKLKESNKKNEKRYLCRWKCHMNKRRHFKKKNNNQGVKSFIDYELIFIPGKSISYFDLYNAYVKWCVNNYVDFLTYMGFFLSLYYHTRNKAVYKRDDGYKGMGRSFCGAELRKNKLEQLELGI